MDRIEQLRAEALAALDRAEAALEGDEPDMEAHAEALAEAEALTAKADALASAESRISTLRRSNAAPTEAERRDAPRAGQGAQAEPTAVEPRSPVTVLPGDRPRGYVPGLLASQQATTVIENSEFLRSQAAGELDAFMAYCQAMGDFGRASFALTDEAGREAMQRLMGASIDVETGAPMGAAIGAGTTGVPIPTPILPSGVDAMGEFGRMLEFANQISVTSPTGKTYVPGAVAAAGWGDDVAAIAEKTQTRTLVPYDLNVVGGFEDISDLAQWGSSVDIVAGYIAAATRGIGGALSAGIFNGTGSTNHQPRGISNAATAQFPATRIVTLASNTGPTWPEILKIIQKISALYRPNARWFTSSGNSAAMRSTEVGAAKGTIAMSVDGPIGGKPVVEDDAAGFGALGANGTYGFFGDLRSAYAIFRPVGQPFFARVGDRWGSDALLQNRIGVYTFADGRITFANALASFKK